MYNIKDLETNGFVVIKNFLSHDTVEKYVSLYNSDTDKKRKLASGIKVITGNFDHNLDIQSILDEVHKETGIRVDITLKKPSFFDNEFFEIDWHQDHEPYWLTQDSYNSLNFWIPIVKSNSKTSGIVFVPNSSLPDDVKKITHGTGAKTFVRKDNKTIITDNSYGEVYETEFDLDANSVTPEISVGDLILIRADCIHKSQIPTEHRIAMSIRCYYSQSKIYREKFFSGCEVKNSRIAKDQLRYKPIVDSFKKTTNDYIFVADTLL